MPKFDKHRIKELKELLFNSYAGNTHDAIIESFQYEYGEGRLKVETFHPFYRVRLSFTFHDIEILLATKGYWHGSRETILGLTVSEDLSYLQNCLPRCREDIEDSLYFMFQTFSGNELHIVCREVSIEIEKQ